MSDLIEHLEKYLGPIVAGWKDSDGTSWPYQIAQFEPTSIAGAVAYSTLGLHRTPLRSATSSKAIRHELLFVTDSKQHAPRLPALLHQVASETIFRGQAYLRGEVTGPRNRLFENGEMTAFYVTLPTCFPDSFAIHRADEGESTVFAWMIPITNQETQFIHDQGWLAFEHRMKQAAVNFMDFERKSIA